MSASLVGSEMCIRDRSDFVLSSSRLNSSHRLNSSYRLARMAFPHLPTPVSYTHLTLPTICSV
eukprot:8015996-Alexandrium_andersonii.AAC.1